MRLLSFSTESDPLPRFGIRFIDDTGNETVADLSAIGMGQDLDEFVRLGGLRMGQEAIEHRAASQPRFPVEDVRFEKLLSWPRKIFCIGVNYGGRAAEYADKTDAAWPSVFLRYPDSFTGHEHPLIRPPESPQLDYEGEIVVVIGKGGRRITRDAALDHIGGFSLGNEGTIRDWVRHAKFNVTQGKNWTATGAIGPWLVTPDEITRPGEPLVIADIEALRIQTHVNGELRQDDTPASMKYPIDYQIHYLSTFTELHPGDVIFTGTPTGAGARMDPPVWLKPGDVVEVSVPEFGTLRNTVVDEFAAEEIARGNFEPPEPQ